MQTQVPQRPGWPSLARRSSFLLACLMLLLAAPAQAADLKAYMVPCEDSKMCPWFKSAVKPPKDWKEDKDWSDRYQALFLFLHGKNDKDLPIMYVRAHPGDAAQTIEDYISVAQDRWKAEDASNVIEEKDSVVRAGKPEIKVYLYSNPSVADQAFELTAFMKDKDPKHPGSTFFFQIVLSSPSMSELGKAEAAFHDLLERL
jgi:hypothetical protein